MSVISGVMGANAAEDAASEQANASSEASASTLQATREAIASQETLTREGIAFQEKMYQQARDDTAPWRTAGENALNKLMGTSGASSKPNPEDFMATPKVKTSESEVVANFNDLFDRDPATEGLEYWRNSGLTGDELRSSMRAGATGEDDLVETARLDAVAAEKERLKRLEVAEANKEVHDYQ